MTLLRASSGRATDEKAFGDEPFGVPFCVYTPDSHGWPWSSWYTNQMNIWTNGNFAASEIDCLMYAACVEYGNAERVLGTRLMAVLRDPDRNGLAVEPLLEVVVEARKRRE